MSYARATRSVVTALAAIISSLWKLYQRDRSEPGEHWFDTEVVGESYRAHVLRDLYGWGGDGKRYFDARLEPEPHNPHDQNAVRVLIGGGHVGYLPRAYAKRYVKKHGRQDHECRAVIVSREGGYGVWLDFTI